MARTEVEIRDDIQSVRDAMRAMECDAESSVGLRNAVDLGGRVEQGVRPSYDALTRRLRDLEAELAAILGRSRVARSRYSRGL